MRGSTWFRCSWCGHKFMLHVGVDPEKAYYGHVDWCRERHLNGSIVREARKARGRLASGFVTDPVIHERY